MGKIKFIVYLSALLIISLQTTAQNRERNNERNGRETFNRDDFFAKRNTYLTEKMALTTEEAAVFFPLDNELWRKKFEAGLDCRRYARELNNKKEKTDEEFKKLLKCREDAKAKSEQLDKEYFGKFKKILCAEKILKYQKADKEFLDDFFRNRR